MPQEQSNPTKYTICFTMIRGHQAKYYCSSKSEAEVAKNIFEDAGYKDVRAFNTETAEEV